MVAPRAASSRATTAPTLPNPWTATLRPSSFSFLIRRISSSTNTTPRPVAMSRPSVPPSTIGLPVTISGTGWPTCWE